MTKPEVGVIMPLFVVRSAPRTLGFYRDKWGFEITFQGPEAGRRILSSAPP